MTVGAFIRGGTHLSYTRAVPFFFGRLRDLALVLTELCFLNVTELCFLKLLSVSAFVTFHTLGGLLIFTRSRFAAPLPADTFVVLFITFRVHVAVVVTPDVLDLSDRALCSFGGEDSLVFAGFDRNL